MGAERRVRVMLCSAGRRVYLVRWFREAFATLGLDGDVVVLDADPSCATGRFADHFRIVPRFTDPAYADALAAVVADLRPDLVLSLNDYELEMLAGGLADRLRRTGAAVLSLDAAGQALAGDKWALACAVPPEYRTPTVLASDRAGVAALVARHERVVVKHRLGSGSSGLAVVPGTAVHAAVERSAATAPRPGGAAPGPAEDWVVVQQHVDGTEYGVDAVFSVHGSPTGTPSGVSARRKLRMRSGETDQAVTVDPAPFAGVAAAVGRLVSPRGIVDLDVLVDASGRQHLIDVNPRFGGGYPFSHLAGVDVPAYLVAEVTGARDPAAHLEGRVGVTASKYEEVTLARVEERVP
ncbi:ATP-grasp domain-containing protein [Cellulomonas sp.]|uniref:ATP-grasp domain-containing protein n=1 Tax=Cellulomonas sp. TaxID=40001 RepID=UPI0028127C76|nr:ATP-grasp domain-containing protein [Cellulomonas sp.]